MKKLRNTIACGVAALALLATGLTSCTGDFDNINTSKDKPTPEDVDRDNAWAAFIQTMQRNVFAEGAKATEAEEAGADIVGSDDLVAQIAAGNIEFDAAIATPNMMGKVGRLGKILGPRGLMPNPKLGTVTMDVAKMVAELKAGRVEYRADRYGICHVPMGKASFDTEKLVENYGALYTELLRVKPSSAKGKYVKSIAVSTTMGPGIKVDTAITRDFMA